MPRKGSKMAANAIDKNSKFVNAFIEDLKAKEVPTDVNIARILKKLGDGRVEVFYINAKGVPTLTHAVIRGSYRGKARYTVKMEIGSIVLVADSGVPGSASLEIMGLLNQEYLDKIRKYIDIDGRVLSIDNTDGARLLDGSADDDGIIFENDPPPKKEDEDDEIDVDKI